jgi:hypothetical protein
VLEEDGLPSSHTSVGQRHQFLTTWAPPETAGFPARASQQENKRKVYPEGVPPIFFFLVTHYVYCTLLTKSESLNSTQVLKDGGLHKGVITNR